MKLNTSFLFTFLIALLIGSYFLYDYLFDEEVSSLSVTSIEGNAWQVEEGKQSELKVGVSIVAGRRVLVNDDSKLGLTLGETQINLESNTSVQIQSISKEHIELSIDEGRIRARARRGSPQIKIESRSGKAQLSNGQILLDVSEIGGIQVTVEEGNAELQSLQQRLVLNSGESGSFIENSPTRLPEVNLNPYSNETSDNSVIISGTAPPGTIVSAIENRVFADQSMKFAIQVPLKIGDNLFTLTVQSPLEEQLHIPIEITRHAPPPVLHHAEIQWNSTPP